MKQLLARPWLALTVLALSAGASSSFAGGTNLLTNPGFEDGGGSYNGWFTFGNNEEISTASTDDIMRTGAAASKIYGDFGACPGPPVPGLRVNGYGQSFSAPAAGVICEFSGYSYVSSADVIPGSNPCSGIENSAVAKVVFFDAAMGGTELASNEMTIGDSQSPTDQWMPFRVSIPAPTGAVRVETLILYLQRECDPGAVYVDDTRFCEEAPPPETNLLVNPSFSSGLTGWTTFGNAYSEIQAPLVLTPPASGKLFSTFTPENPSGMSQQFAATSGSAWTFDVYALTSCSDGILGTENFATAKIVFRDGISTEIGAAERVIVDASSPYNSWQKTTVSAYAPPGTESVEAFILFVSPSLEGGAAWIDNASLRELDRTAVPSEPRPAAFRLHQNMPNPFSPSTRIDFDLAERGTVDISVFDVTGRLVATLFQGPLESGEHQVTWDGRTANGSSAATGVYRYVLSTPKGRTSRSMVLIR